MKANYAETRLQACAGQRIVASSPGLSQISPYLNFDPSYLGTTQPEFIFPEGAAKQRGRFEVAFSQIGGGCLGGGVYGGAIGLFNGLRDTQLAGHTGAVRRTQMINYVMKRGAASANTVGVMAVMYFSFGVLLGWARGTDDELNTLTAGTATGLLYKSSAGAKRCLMGGGVGLALAAAYCLATSRDRLQSLRTYS
ncbi:Mitochondrial import inner membrane translocase subunit Tim23 [Amphibalanus amphitrite]|uniref:Mitochondrial import inner membrane translocase subunit Tim23 n=1 Tax=Amphibalanus amphitrite TaxID=1232801 RepID=A0A6A4WRQ9_AMPAM|nr:Mitochondrial import inner membrane translocase subunit Tim23 [Amphibalanus amphitrite]